MFGKVMVGSVDIMVVLGIFFLIYGFVYMALERYWGLPWFYSIDQHNGQINSFVEIIVGWLFLSSSIKIGIILAIILVALSALELKIVFSLLKNREEIFVGKKGKVTKQVYNKGKAIIEGKEYKVFSEEGCIPVDKEVMVSKLNGGQLVVTQNI